jgi:N-methylhydantoinase A
MVARVEELNQRRDREDVTVVGVDTGGTFLDFFLIRGDGATFARKLPARRRATATLREGLLEVLDEAGVPPPLLTELVHGTTVATNAVLQRAGARTGLLTTEGFRDVLELGRIRVPELYNLLYVKPEPLVERALRLGVRERIAADGSELEPLDRTGAEKRLGLLAEDDVEAVAICLLNSWASPDHEEELAEIAAARHPGLFISVSSRLAPELGEFERTSTTVINAYVGPVVRRYVTEVDDGLRASAIDCPVFVMKSDGTVMDDDGARDRPVALLESGPAAGAIGAREVAVRAGIADAIAFDMGGTTAKAALIEDGRLSTTSEFDVGGSISSWGGFLGGDGYPVRLPALDLAEVGVGGGSVVTIDAGGSLRVGPESAGAEPGPACYGFGGSRATVTDANAVLGYLCPGGIAGGVVPIQVDRARAAVTHAVGEPLGMTVDEAAATVHAVANATMVPVIRALTTWRGRDPRAFTLIAFGGNGAIHGVGLARSLGIRRILVPPRPGLLSAMGLLYSTQQQHRIRAVWQRLGDVTPEALESMFAAEERKLDAELQTAANGAAHEFERGADLRYLGQGHELTVAVENGSATSTSVTALAARFAAEHGRTYGHAFEGSEIELVNLRVTARITRTPPEPAPVVEPARDDAGVEDRRAYFAQGGPAQARVVSRDDLDGAARPGPLLVDEYDTTIVIPPGCTAAIDAHRNVIVHVD